MTENLPEVKKENALETIRFDQHGFQLTTLAEVYRYAQFVLRAGMAPQSLDSPEKIVVAIQSGCEVGLTYQQSMDSIAVIHGSPCMWGKAIVALVHASGKCKYMRDWIEGEGDDRIAYCEGARTDNATIIRRSFSVEDAKAAKLWGVRNWGLYPSRRLGMKPISYVMRDLFADVLMGMGVREEVEDYTLIAPKRITLAPAPADPSIIDAEVVTTGTPEDSPGTDDPEPPDALDENVGADEAEAYRQQEIESESK